MTWRVQMATAVNPWSNPGIVLKVSDWSNPGSVLKVSDWSNPGSVLKVSNWSNPGSVLKCRGVARAGSQSLTCRPVCRSAGFRDTTANVLKVSWRGCR